MEHIERFADRHEAGRRLAARLGHLAAERPLVIGLPRGGVPVAMEVAAALHAPLDVLVVRKLGAPGQPEVAMGAVGEHGVLVRNLDIIAACGVGETELAAVERATRRDVQQRVERFRGALPPESLAGRTVIVVDDGVATGATARAALQVARALGAARVVLAVPVAAPDSLDVLQHEADELVVLLAPDDLWAVGTYYENFTAVPDEEVVRLLAEARRRRPAAVAPGSGGSERGGLRITVPGAELEATLVVPDGAAGTIIFAHGSGSGRHSARNGSVAAALRRAGLATLLLDLLTPAEAGDRWHTFDVVASAARLLAVTARVRSTPATANLPVGYFGGSTGAAVALWAAAEPGNDVFAVVSRAGRTDLARLRLAEVRAPTLLLVGGFDDVVIELNRRALRLLQAEKRLELVPGASHRFDEPGALEAVATAACTWFLDHLPGRPAAADHEAERPER